MDDVSEFLRQFRKATLTDWRRVYVDFRPLRQIGPCGALVLAAELDRWRLLGGFHPRVRDLAEWDLEVTRLLNEMGMFRLLRASGRPPPTKEPYILQFLPFISAETSAGILARELRVSIETLLGPLTQKSVAGIFQVLTEAMQNAVSHAYREDIPAQEYVAQPVRRRWWMSGSVDRSAEKVSLIFLDHGFGIPTTMKLHRSEQVIQLVASFFGKSSDAHIIKAATEVMRTGTGQPGRGRGLTQMKETVESFSSGHLRIISGHGEYTFNANTSEDLKELKFSLGGTIIEWVFSIKALGSADVQRGGVS
jgi:hypothetical protein